MGPRHDIRFRWTVKCLDETLPGPTGCRKCHPGPNTARLHGTMANDYGMICQDCHGDMRQVSGSIAHDGRVPWIDEPSCRECHTPLYGEPETKLYRNSTGHGGRQDARGPLTERGRSSRRRPPSASES